MPRVPIQKAKQVPLSVVRQMATLSSSGFSLVAALAWNDVIRRFIDEFIKPYISKGSGIIAQLIYAVGITVIVVLFTLQLAWIQERLEQKETSPKTPKAKKK